MASPDPVNLPEILFPNQTGSIPAIKYSNGISIPAMKSSVPVFYELPEKPIIIAVYYEYRDGSRIPNNEVQVGDEVNWVVESKNLAGKSITINFGSNNKDFEYNGVALVDDECKRQSNPILPMHHR